MRRQLFIVTIVTIVLVVLSGCERGAQTSQVAPPVSTTPTSGPVETEATQFATVAQAIQSETIQSETTQSETPASPSDWAAKADYDKSTSPMTNMFKNMFSVGRDSNESFQRSFHAIGNGPTRAKHEMALQDEAELTGATERFYFEEGKWPVDFASDLVDKGYFEEIPVNPITGHSSVRIVPNRAAMANVDQTKVGWFWLVNETRFAAAGKPQPRAQAPRRADAEQFAAEINGAIERYYFENGEWPQPLKAELERDYFPPAEGFPANPLNGSDVVVEIASNADAAKQAGNRNVGWLYNVQTHRVTPNK